MKKKAKWIMIGAGITAATATVCGVAAAVSHRISKFVVDTALDRQGPKPLKGTKNPNNSVVPEELNQSN